MLWFAPHLVLDGLQAAAEAVGARSAYLYLHARSATSPRLIWPATSAKRWQAGRLPGPTELWWNSSRHRRGSSRARRRRWSRRSTAEPARPGNPAAGSFERGVGRPPHSGSERRDTGAPGPDRQARRGLVPRCRHGGRARLRAVYRARADGRVRVVETALGTPLERLIWLGDDVQAVLAGGYHGGWLAAAAARRPVAEQRRPAPGWRHARRRECWSALPAAYCGLAETAHVARFLALESAGQCGPCFNGLPAIATALAAVAQPRPASSELANLRRWAGLVTGRGGCHHPDGTARFVATALEVFGGELAAHDRGRCTATRHDRFLPLPAAAADRV